MEKPKRKRTVILVVSVLVVLIGVIGITYAYFTAGSLDSDSSITVTTAKIGLVYESGSTMSGVNIAPGWTESKTFTVKNNSTVVLYYEILWTDVSNTFVTKEDLVYSLTCVSDVVSNTCSGVSETIFPSSEESILSNLEIEPNELHTYTLTVTYKDQPYNQIDNMGATYAGRIVVRESEKATLKDAILANNGGASAIEAKGNPTFGKAAVSQEYYDSLPAGSQKTNSVVENGMWAMEDEYGTSYYYRGGYDIVNNNVIFAGFQWKVIRINGDGSIRLIYNGTQAQYVSNGNTMNITGADTTIGNYAWNTINYNDNKYLGYMYGGANGTASVDYVGATYSKKNDSNSTSSNAKTILETWYHDNPLNQGNNITDKIVDNLFCNDRNPSSSTSTTNGIGGYGTTTTYYPASQSSRLTNPSLKCQNTQGDVASTNDQFTVSQITYNHPATGSKTIGNGGLTYPIGLITYDEAILAGGYSTTNNSYYLHTNQIYWTMSPYQRDIGFMMVRNVSTSGFSSGSVDSPIVYLRPVVSLSSAVEISSGDGSLSNPFVIAS